MACPIVNLSPDASLQGKVTFAKESRKPVYAYLGIPFAEPPVGPRRFFPPEPQKQLWKGTRDATKFGPACPQPNPTALSLYQAFNFNIPTFSEDCLYLNVYTPKVDPVARNLSVLVWIHGGSFILGFSNIYDGTALVTYEDVIVVTINYRVGVFGHLRTSSQLNGYHGNQGLQDQCEAFRWIKKYIHNFGGDPNNITVFGESAGGMSISYHILSPKAKGLFRRAICESGSCMQTYGLWPVKAAEKLFWKKIDAMGFTGKSFEELIAFLSSKSSEDLLSGFNLGFMPTVVDGTYIPDTPRRLYNTGSCHKVDLLIGFNSSEGVRFMPLGIDTCSAAERNIRQMLAKEFFRASNQKVKDDITELAVNEYTKKGQTNFSKTVADMYGDVVFVAPSILQATKHSRLARTYVYHFDHRPSYSPNPDWVGADHANEIPYVFGYPFLDYSTFDWFEEEKQLSRNIMKYWANFAKTGNPNSEDVTVWNQFTEDRPLYLNITASDQTVKDGQNFHPDRIKLWNEKVLHVLDKYSNLPSKY